MKKKSTNFILSDQNKPVMSVETRKQLSEEYGVTEKTFARRLKYHHQIKLPPGVITPKYLEIIYKTLGKPAMI